MINVLKKVPRESLPDKDQEYIRLVMAINDDVRPPSKKYLGKFSIGIWQYQWVVNPRSDMRHGITAPPDLPSDWAKYQFESMFRNWGK